jgi:hypothetical protein
VKLMRSTWILSLKLRDLIAIPGPSHFFLPISERVVDAQMGHIAINFVTVVLVMLANFLSKALKVENVFLCPTFA